MHTQGNWEFETVNNTEQAITCDGKIIAFMHSYYPVRDNARLISSAPDLLEACKESIKLLRQYPAYVGINKIICEHIEQAIAKAEDN